ncbi:MAG: hypothetical protein NT087_12210 [Deltaproteobacteria bacterium]|nr:hypothetical protein [Deltaproteobacteria bacterium]
MKIVLWICGFLVFATPALAEGINVPGELSHVAGGALIAGVITGTVADKYWPEHRAMIGFTGSTAVILVGEGLQMAEGEKFSDSLLDIASHMFGAMLGATITDRFLLLPIVEHDKAGATKIGMMMRQSF